MSHYAGGLKAAQKRYLQSDKGRAARKAYRNRPEVKERENVRRLARVFGVTADQYAGMLEAQGHRCAICKTHRSELSKALAVDHDHATGQVRGLLCIPCNVAIGNFRDDQARLLAAVEYLARHGAK